MSNLIKGKFQSFTNNGKTKVNCLVSMKELQRIAADDGYVAFTIIPQSDEFKENKEHVKKYGRNTTFKNRRHDRIHDFS